jgi:DNA-binding response OmpR family regulator
VDDDRELTDLLVHALDEAGYEVMAAQSATEALAAIATASPDLAVLDIKMPGTPGLNLSELLRDQFAIPFVFFSALDNEETVRQATMMGALAYLVKPLDMRHLVPAIGAAVARADELRRLRQSESQLSTEVDTRGSFMQIVDPPDQLRCFDTLDIQVVYETTLAAARQHALQLEVGARIDLLVGHVRRHVDEITCGSFGFEFEALAPAQSGNPVENVDHGLQVAVVMGTGLRLRINSESAGPELRRARVRRRHRGDAMQARRLGYVGIELFGADDPHTVCSPPAR